MAFTNYPFTRANGLCKYIIDLSQVQSVSINSEIVKHKKGAKGLQISVPGTARSGIY